MNMKNELTLKRIILGEYSDRDIEEVFRDLIEENRIPNNLETKSAMEIMQNLPWYYNRWRNIQSIDESLIES